MKRLFITTINNGLIEEIHTKSIPAPYKGAGKINQFFGAFSGAAGTLF